jgi:hypothetical protein
MDKSRQFPLLWQESKASYQQLLGRQFKFSVTQSMTCWCPKQQLSDPDVVFPCRDTEDVRERAAEEPKKLLNSNG